MLLFDFTDYLTAFAVGRIIDRTDLSEPIFDICFSIHPDFQLTYLLRGLTVKIFGLGRQAMILAASDLDNDLAGLL